jgi:SAM-dependent methyltransferase
VNWKLKALVQTGIALLPDALARAAYFQVQRLLGGLRRTDPTSRLLAGAEIASRIVSAGGRIDGAAILEVGTGHQVNVPIALWLCGARAITTVDLNPYLSAELVRADLRYIATHSTRIAEAFAAHAERQEFHVRLRALVSHAEAPLDDVFGMLGLRYEAPADASALPTPAGAFDHHVSYTVLEHIPPAMLRAILTEGRRVLAPGGLFVHCIDFSDHFSHGDPAISSVNFLRFSEREWGRWAGNRFMYHNRLRLDDFSALVEDCGLTVLALDATVDPVAEAILVAGALPLAPRFAGKPPRVNATRNAWLVARATG